MRKLVALAPALTYIWLAASGVQVQAQTYYTPSQLDQLMQPLALYPDPLLAQILPACAFPQEIDDVTHFLQDNGSANLDSQQWDPPVQAVAHYPEVLNMLDQNLAWTSSVGQAYANQAQDVMASIQRLRMQASQTGNLVSGPQESVDVQGDYVTINPTNPAVIYVPEYNPAYVYQAYPYGYPRPGMSFSVGFGTGAWLNFGIDWMGGNVVPYPAGIYWGAGNWNQWASGGGYTNVTYFHNNFNGNNQNFYRLNRQRFAQNQLSPARYNQARIQDYRGAAPVGSPALPQWHGGVTNSIPGPAAHPQVQPSERIQPPASVTHGPQGVFNVPPQPQTQTYQQRGEASLRSQPNTNGFQGQRQGPRGAAGGARQAAPQRGSSRGSSRDKNH